MRVRRSQHLAFQLGKTLVAGPGNGNAPGHGSDTNGTVDNFHDPTSIIHAKIFFRNLP
jgi:hypothetical protein